ncbi:MAG: hypothetical protein K6F92_08050 [Lachnospiraceae bacterium]|nr:hypothetical protein [Lachnospiraceae bacterium]
MGMGRPGGPRGGAPRGGGPRGGMGMPGPARPGRPGRAGRPGGPVAGPRGHRGPVRPGPRPMPYRPIPRPMPHPYFRMPPYSLAMNVAWDIYEYRRIYNILQYIKTGYPISPADRAYIIRVFGRPITPYEVDELLYYMQEQMGYF